MTMSQQLQLKSALFAPGRWSQRSNYVERNPFLTESQKRVLMVYLDYIKKSDAWYDVFPYDRTVADQARLSKRHFYRVKKSLLAGNYLTQFWGSNPRPRHIKDVRRLYFRVNDKLLETDLKLTNKEIMALRRSNSVSRINTCNDSSRTMSNLTNSKQSNVTTMTQEIMPLTKYNQKKSNQFSDISNCNHLFRNASHLTGGSDIMSCPPSDMMAHIDLDLIKLKKKILIGEKSHIENSNKSRVASLPAVGEGLALSQEKGDEMEDSRQEREIRDYGLWHTIRVTRLGHEVRVDGEELDFVDDTVFIGSVIQNFMGCDMQDFDEFKFSKKKQLRNDRGNDSDATDSLVVGSAGLNATRSKSELYAKNLERQREYQKRYRAKCSAKKKEQLKKLTEDMSDKCGMAKVSRITPHRLSKRLFDFFLARCKDSGIEPDSNIQSDVDVRCGALMIDDLGYDMSQEVFAFAVSHWAILSRLDEKLDARPSFYSVTAKFRYSFWLKHGLKDPTSDEKIAARIKQEDELQARKKAFRCDKPRVWKKFE